MHTVTTELHWKHMQEHVHAIRANAKSDKGKILAIWTGFQIGEWICNTNKIVNGCSLDSRAGTINDAYSLIALIAVSKWLLCFDMRLGRYVPQEYNACIKWSKYVLWVKLFQMRCGFHPLNASNRIQSLNALKFLYALDVFYTLNILKTSSALFALYALNA